MNDSVESYKEEVIPVTIEMNGKDFLALLITWGRLYVMASGGWCRGGRLLWCERARWLRNGGVNSRGIRIGCKSYAAEVGI